MKRSFLFSLCSLVSTLNFASDIDLRSMQWGIKNTGQVIYRQDDALTQGPVEGKSGVDIASSEITITKKKDIIVAVIDHGLDKEHPDLVQNLWKKEGPCFVGKEGDTSNECSGWNFLDDNENYIDTNGHGTHVAGIIAASLNELGIDGVAASVAKIMPLKVLADDLEGLTYNKKVLTYYVAKAMNFALDNGASVINMSLGWPKIIHERDIELALSRAYEMNVPVVVASGNNNKSNPVYPCSHRTVICVGAIDNQGLKGSFSNYGLKVDMYAPGEGIVSTYPTVMESRSLRIGGYERKNGSSQAAPFVAGALALYRHEYPQASIGQIKANLYDSSRPLDFSSKYGLLQINKLLENKSTGIIDPVLKSLTEVELRDSGKFLLEIPLDVLGANLTKVVASIKTQGNVVDIENRSISLDLQNDKAILSFKGEVLNDMGDSHIPFTLELSYEGKTREYRGEFVLIKDIERELRNKSLVLKNIPRDLVSYFSGDRKLSRLKRVFDKARLDSDEEYFYFDPKRIKEVVDATPLNILSTDGNSFRVIELHVPKAQSVFGVFKVDIDGDGKADYMTYSLGKDEGLYFKFFAKDGSPLFGKHSTWSLENNGFDPISVKDRIEQLEMMRISHPVLGQINVPSFAKAWFIPSADNSQDFFSELPNNKKERLYYFNPIVKGDNVEIEIRTLENFDFVTQMSERLNLDIGDEINLIHVYSQTAEDKVNGHLKALYIVEGFLEDQVYKISFKNKTVASVQRLDLKDFSLQNNTVETFEEEVAHFSSLLSRNSMRYFNENNEAKIFDSKDWSDPAFRLYNVLGEKALVESRYYMWLVEGDHMQKLPLDRESSFPGPSFTETFDKLSGMSVLINSSLVVGNRIYMMKEVEGEFIRPIRYSVSIPSNCIVMDVHEFADGMYKSFMCQSGSNVALRWLKLD